MTTVFLPVYPMALRIRRSDGVSATSRKPLPLTCLFLKHICRISGIANEAGRWMNALPDSIFPRILEIVLLGTSATTMWKYGFRSFSSKGWLRQPVIAFWLFSKAFAILPSHTIFCQRAKNPVPAWSPSKSTANGNAISQGTKPDGLCWSLSSPHARRPQ